MEVGKDGGNGIGANDVAVMKAKTLPARGRGPDVTRRIQGQGLLSGLGSPTGDPSDGRDGLEGGSVVSTESLVRAHPDRAIGSRIDVEDRAGGQSGLSRWKALDPSRGQRISVGGLLSSEPQGVGPRGVDAEHMGIGELIELGGTFEFASVEAGDAVLGGQPEETVAAEMSNTAAMTGRNRKRRVKWFIQLR